jgi:tetratricopeptide (TPR) repeat protein
MYAVLELQQQLIQLVKDQAYHSAEILAQGLLIEAPATTSLASSQNSPLTGPGSPVQTLVLLAEALSKAGEYRRSVTTYKQAQQLLSRNHRRRGSSTTKITKQNDDTVLVYNNLCQEMGYCWEKLGDQKKAIEALQKIEENQRSVSVQLKLGRLHRTLGQKSLAKKCYSSVWQRNPFALEAAHWLIHLGEKAETLLEQCRGAHTSCAPWIPTMIQAYGYECRFAPREALKCLDSLGAAFDASLDVLLQKGRLNLQLNDISRSIQLYERAHRLDSANVVGMDLYALCLYERRNIMQLNALAQSLLVTAGTKRPEPWIAAALHSLVEHKDEKALSLIEQACQAGPQHSMSFYVKGLILDDKEINASLRCFRAAKTLLPSIHTFSKMVTSLVKGKLYFFRCCCQ